MKKFKLFNVVFFFLILSLIGCSSLNPKFYSINEVKLSTEAKIARDFLNDKGYKVVAYSKETSSSYVLTDEKLNDPAEPPYQKLIWNQPGISPDKYMGKTIFNERFIVTNHPLDTYPHGEGKTYVDVMVVDGHPIGGISAPVTKEKLVGAPYSLDGKPLEQIQNK